MKKQNKTSERMKKNMHIGTFAFICTLANLLIFTPAFSQNISFNTTGAANSTSSMVEVLQPTTAANNSVGIFSRHAGAAFGNAYAIWAEATGATNKYAIVVPSGGGNVGIGTTTPTALLEVAGQIRITGGTPGVNKVLTSDATGLCSWTLTGVPTGLIIMWSGAIASIPAGWALCDGGGGRPDLRNRFVYGTGGVPAPGTTGGLTTTLTAANIPQLSGTFTSTSTLPPNSAANICRWTPGFGSSMSFSGPSFNSVNVDPHTHNTTVTLGNAVPTNVDVKPPHYVLAYIIKT